MHYNKFCIFVLIIKNNNTMNNKPKKNLKRGFNLNRPCCTCNDTLYGFRSTKRYCDDDCRYEFHRRADKQLINLLFIGFWKFLKRNTHLVELVLGPQHNTMWISQLELEILGFRLGKCVKRKIKGKSRLGAGKYMYVLPNYHIYKYGGRLLVQRVASNSMGGEREFIFNEGTHERYLWDPDLPSCSESSTVKYEKLFERGNSLIVTNSDLAKLDDIFSKYVVWRL